MATKTKKPNAAKCSPQYRFVNENLDLTALWSEGYNGNDKLFVIPVKDEFVNSKTQSLDFGGALVLVVDNNRNIKYGNIILYPATLKKNVENNNTFSNLLNSRPLTGSGKFLIQSVSGRRLMEKKYERGILSSIGVIQNNNTTGSSRQADACIDWYLVTYYYVDGQLVDTTSEYAGTTCDGCDSPMNQGLCPTGDGGGEIPVYSYSKAVEWVVDAANDYSWHVKSYEVLNAQKTGSDPAVFTNITHTSSAVFNTPGGPNSATWTQLNAVVNLSSSNSLATSTISGKVTTASGDYPVNLKSKAWASFLEFP